MANRFGGGGGSEVPRSAFKETAPKRVTLELQLPGIIFSHVHSQAAEAPGPREKPLPLPRTHLSSSWGPGGPKEFPSQREHLIPPASPGPHQLDMLRTPLEAS